jgi:Fe-S cluster assembly protein SufD
MFTPEEAAELPGPDWLRVLRVAAAERLVTEPLPTPKLEEWRYSPVDSIDLADFTPVNEAGDVPDDSRGLADLGGLAVLSNGHLVSIRLDEEATSAGVTFRSAADHDSPVALAEGPDAFSLTNLALAPSPLLLDIPSGVQLDRPIGVLNWIDADGALVLPRLEIVAGGNASVEVLNVSRSTPVAALVLSAVGINAASGARVALTTIQELAHTVTQIANHGASVGSQANVDESLVAVGGSYTRQRNDCELVGRGASAQLSALYFGDDDQILDFRTFYDHIAPDTTSNLLFKGALDDAAKSVYSGLIRVHPEARGTNAMQTNRNLKLSDETWAESVPNLEIENNDVHCAHASTMGPIDAEHRFYLESRGVPPAIAERLIVSGFFDEALDRLSVGSARGAARALVDNKIGTP